jgi:hypothetical protein
MHVEDKGSKKLTKSGKKRQKKGRTRKRSKRQEDRLTLGKIGFRQLGQMSIRKRKDCIL